MKKLVANNIVRSFFTPKASRCISLAQWKIALQWGIQNPRISSQTTCYLLTLSSASHPNPMPTGQQYTSLCIEQNKTAREDSFRSLLLRRNIGRPDHHKGALCLPRLILSLTQLPHHPLVLISEVYSIILRVYLLRFLKLPQAHNYGLCSFYCFLGIAVRAILNSVCALYCGCHCFLFYDVLCLQFRSFLIAAFVTDIFRHPDSVPCTAVFLDPLHSAVLISCGIFKGFVYIFLKA